MQLSKTVFYLIAFVLLILLVCVGYQWHCFYVNSYQTILKTYLVNHPDIYRHHLFGKQLFTPKTYQQALVWLLVGFNVTYLLKAFWWHYQTPIISHIQKLSEDFKSIKKTFMNIFLAHTSTQKKMFIGLVGCVLIHQIYMYNTIFVAMDESFSWLYFASQGVSVTITHYPVPNNHVFYNLCSSFWNLLIIDDILAIRITALLSFWALWSMCYVYLYRKFNFSTAYVSSIILGLGFSQSVFSVQARGYMLCTFLIVLAFFCLLEYLEKRTSFYLFIFTIACILGFFTIPVFLFAMIAFYGYLLWQFFQKRHQDTFQTFFVVGLIVMACVFLLYLPILVYSGKNALFGNENVSPTSYDSHKFFTYILPIAFRESIIYVFSIPKYVAFTGALFVTIAGFYLFKNRKKLHLPLFYEKFWSFIAVSLFTAGIVICIMRAFPFYRVWTYYAVFLSFMLGIVLSQWMQTFVNIRLILFLVLIFIFSFTQFHREIEDFYEPQSYIHHKKIEKEIRECIESKKTIHSSEEAFYVRFWLKYHNAENLLKENPCSAEIIIQDVQYPPPICYKNFRDISFLRVYQNN
ncbi:hypothetical protein AD998_17520 [bacterium 336/3]|nr:hypothetical protein AD998_17520 [bacterium 336/3]